MEGWIKLHREFLEWEWYDHAPTKLFFLHCLLKANHTEKEWRGTVIQRGEFITSLKNLCKETGFSVKQIRTILGKLKGKELAIKTSSQHTVIQVVKYDQYQSKANEGQANGQSKGYQRATTKNDNNDNKNSILSFDDFWEMYDRRTGSKKKCQEKYSKISEEDRQKIKRHVPKYVSSTPDKQFRKHPLTYLNQESWNDEIIGEDKKAEHESWKKANSKPVGTVNDIF